MTIAIIPARGGSRRIPGKNKRLFHGRPIIEYSIETAKRSGLFDKILVSTDDDEIFDIALANDVAAHKRSPQWARNKVGTMEVTGYVLDILKQNKQYTTDYACCIYATAPLMTHIDLIRGHRLVRKINTDYVFSIGIDQLRDAGQWYWGSTDAFIRRVPLDWDSRKVLKYVIPNDRVCDVNIEADWLRAEQMYQALQEGK